MANHKFFPEIFLERGPLELLYLRDILLFSGLIDSVIDCYCEN